MAARGGFLLCFPSFLFFPHFSSSSLLLSFSTPALSDRPPLFAVPVMVLLHLRQLSLLGALGFWLNDVG